MRVAAAEVGRRDHRDELAAGEHVHAVPAHAGHEEASVAGELLEPPEVAVLGLRVDARVGAERLGHPGGRNEALAVSEVELAETEQGAARELEAACGRRLASWRALPVGALDAERVEELSPREVGEGFAKRPLERDPEGDDAGRAVAEAGRLPERQPEREPE